MYILLLSAYLAYLSRTGGRTYVVSLVVSLKDDPDVAAVVDVQLEIVGSPLVANIKGVSGIKVFPIYPEFRIF